MIKKAKLFEENNKLKRLYFIFQNIGVGTNSTIHEKEIAAKKFKEKFPDYTDYEICSTIKLSRGTFYNFQYKKVEKTTYQIREEFLTKEIKQIFDESHQLYGQNKIQVALKRKGINVTTGKISEIMKKNNLIKKVTIKRPKKQTVRDRQHLYRDLLKRQFNQDAPNRVWVSDFLELNVRGAKFYLCVI